MKIEKMFLFSMLLCTVSISCTSYWPLASLTTGVTAMVGSLTYMIYNIVQTNADPAPTYNYYSLIQTQSYNVGLKIIDSPYTMPFFYAFGIGVMGYALAERGRRMLAKTDDHEVN